MTTTINNEHKKLNVPNLRFPEFQGKWEVESIKDVADFMGGGTPSSSNESFWQGTIPWVSSSDIVENDIKNISISRYITEEAIAHSATKLCPAPSILIVSRVGVGKIALSKEAICTSQDFCNLINIKVEPIFLTYCLSQIMKRKSMEVQGTSIKGITTSEIQKISINIPSLREQKKIGKILSLLDERIATQNKIIDKLQSLIKGIAQKIVHSNKTNVRLSECVECSSSTLQESDVCEHGAYPVYGANGIVGYLDNYNTEGEAVYIIKDGSGVGSVSYVTGKCSATGTLNTLQAKDGYSLQYLYYLLKVFNFEPYKTGMAIPHIYFKDYGKAKIFCPSYTEQLQYARLLSAIDNKLSIEQNILTELSLQKQYLLRQMFI
ncbi:restriction endonuclease subunit S [Bacteroides xylanisolvens]|uniref:restriction endonuclease subunit S n=1 Tax=Bacteroides xylanisolvens TaxID=371601 RepID=UPI0021662C5C|nr:restriction endonuclease subunit S [Bacteroides xylanisolvens]MCS2621782.1 restriction endonuclease subunit S [Bacteroides xylanisolvens]MCS2983628.1 restriction endonuclease subunit S [Bacteroides xylanisolvens]MCS3026935.1 restriction endonuclease subunit S [Bacteroides xylanisolvens]